MTLVVTTFRAPDSGSYIPDPYPFKPGGDLAGPENWRDTVWGSNVLIERGAKFLPLLKRGDLYVENEELRAFRNECKVLLSDVNAVAKELGHSDSSPMAFRLSNFLKAIDIAEKSKVGFM